MDIREESLTSNSPQYHQPEKTQQPFCRIYMAYLQMNRPLHHPKQVLISPIALNELKVGV